MFSDSGDPIASYDFKSDEVRWNRRNGLESENIGPRWGTVYKSESLNTSLWLRLPSHRVPVLEYWISIEQLHCDFVISDPQFPFSIRISLQKTLRSHHHRAALKQASQYIAACFTCISTVPPRSPSLAEEL